MGVPWAAILRGREPPNAGVALRVAVQENPEPWSVRVPWLVISGGQGRGRTADLPLLSYSNLPVGWESAEVGRLSACALKLGWLPQLLLAVRGRLEAMKPLLRARSTGVLVDL